MQPQTIEKLWVGQANDQGVRKLLILFDLQSWLLGLDSNKQLCGEQAAYALDRRPLTADRRPLTADR
jgi:hypothetical protein